MKIYKKLAGQTLIYGLGTIVPKILNYSILTVYYTRLFPVEEFGIITELYAYVAFLMILLTYGTETGYFKFAQNDSENQVFGSLVTSLLVSSLSFVGVVLVLLKKISTALSYEGNEKYILLLACIVAIDAFSTIPFAKIRKEERSKWFASLKIINVLVTIAAVLIFYEILPAIANKGIISNRFDFSEDITFVLIANLIASSSILVLLLPELKGCSLRFNKAILKEVLAYSAPLLVAGLAGNINETLDRVLMRHVIEDSSNALYILGIYGANYRIGVLLFIFVQMFRYAVEPFYFNYHGKPDEKVVFARIMRLFVAVSIIISMIILFYLHYIKYFIAPKFHEGLVIVPIVLGAYVFYGIFFNQSIWYKLQKKTSYAILLTLIGALCTIVANIYFVGKYGYIAAAYGHLAAYFLMMVVSYGIGRKHYLINYNLPRITEYIVIALLIFAVNYYIFDTSHIVFEVVRAILILVYAAYVLYREELLTTLISRHGS